MNYKHFFLTLLLLLSFFSLQAGNDSLRIEIQAPQWKEQKISLCYYFDGKIFKQDSLVLSKKGQGIFHRKENLPEGLYIIYRDSSQYFDLLLADDQSFQIAIDTTNFIGKNQIIGAEQSEAFLSYARYIQEKRKEREKIIADFQALPENKKDKQGVQNSLNTLNQEVSDFQHSFKSKHQQEWVGLFFQGLEPVQTGPYPTPKTQEEAIQEFYYKKSHYFDNINLKDSRFWRTNYFPSKVSEYMNQQVEQIPDSLANAASRLVSQTMGDSLCFRMMLNSLVNYSATSLIMGMENIWAKLAEDYYFTGYVNWGDSAHMANIKSEYNKIKYNRIGMKAYNMDLQDSIGTPIKLYNIGKRYTLVYFYEPSCGHCKKETPRVYEDLYKKYADKGLDVACIYIMIDRKEWMDFVHDNHLDGEHWHNLWDPNRKSYYWQFYNTSSTPSVYVLDENKTIIAKKLDVETLDNLFNSLLGNMSK